jgi:type IX secretion system PorP/SprF family membrane protein
VNKLLSILLILLLISFIVNAQDPSFSQVENTLVYSHPSFNSRDYHYNIGWASLVQWPRVPGGFNTGFLTVNFNIPKKLSLGLSYLRDQEGIGNIGVLITDEPKGIVRYRLTLKKGVDGMGQFLTFAWSFGVISKRINSQELVFSDQIDAVSGMSSQSVLREKKSFFDTDASANFFVKNANFPFLIAFSGHHLTNPNESLVGVVQPESKLSRRLVFTFCTRQLWEKKIKSLNFDIITQIEYQQHLSKMTLGAVPSYINSENNKFSLGFLHTNKYNFGKENTKSFVLDLGYHHKNTFANKNVYYTLNFSWSIPYSGIGLQSAGSFELTYNLFFSKFSYLFKHGAVCPEINNEEWTK